MVWLELKSSTCIYDTVSMTLFRPRVKNMVHVLKNVLQMWALCYEEDKFAGFKLVPYMGIV